MSTKSRVRRGQPERDIHLSKHVKNALRCADSGLRRHVEEAIAELYDILHKGNVRPGAPSRDEVYKDATYRWTVRKDDYDLYIIYLYSKQFNSLLIAKYGIADSEEYIKGAIERLRFP